MATLNETITPMPQPTTLDAHRETAHNVALQHKRPDAAFLSGDPRHARTGIVCGFSRGKAVYVTSRSIFHLIGRSVPVRPSRRRVL